MRRRSSGSAAEEEGEGEETLSNVEEFDGVKKELSTTDHVDLQQTLPRPSETQHSYTPRELDRRKSTDKRPSTARSRQPSNTNWKTSESRNGTVDKHQPPETPVIIVPSTESIAPDKMADSRQNARRPRLRSPWSCSPLTLVTTALALLLFASISHSFVSRQLDTKGCRMSYMRPSFAKLSEFDTEHTRFASKYSVYLYREGMVDEDTKVWNGK